jgi:hypothetical protein
MGFTECSQYFFEKKLAAGVSRKEGKGKKTGRFCRDFPLHIWKIVVY